MIPLRFLAAVAFWLPSLAIGSVGQECARFDENYTRDQLLAFLNQQLHDKTDQDCIVFALRKLGTTEPAPVSAAPVLAEYLDYKRPLTEGEKAGIFRRPPIISELYPAAGALFLTGKGVLPLLVKIIGESATSDIKRQNAVFTLMGISREDDRLGVALLKDAAAKANNPSDAQRLSDAARDAVRWCASQKRAECEGVLNK